MVILSITLREMKKIINNPNQPFVLCTNGMMDNRGTARRSLKFEGAIKYNCGRINIEDQLAGAEWLIKQELAQVEHIGVFGWRSYGGYLSARTLAMFPDVSTCAISGSPVTSWDGYDTFYTEKYMG